jgi:alpha-aminoadipate carrier protein LysW
MITCPECENSQTVITETVRPSEIIECGECRTELEVVSTDPLVVEVAPEVEEDWGE